MLPVKGYALRGLGYAICGPLIFTAFVCKLILIGHGLAGALFITGILLFEMRGIRRQEQPIALSAGYAEAFVVLCILLELFVFSTTITAGAELRLVTLINLTFSVLLVFLGVTPDKKLTLPKIRRKGPWGK